MSIGGLIDGLDWVSIVDSQIIELSSDSRAAILDQDFVFNSSPFRSRNEIGHDNRRVLLFDAFMVIIAVPLTIWYIFRNQLHGLSTAASYLPILPTMMPMLIIRAAHWSPVGPCLGSYVIEDVFGGDFASPGLSSSTMDSLTDKNNRNRGLMIFFSWLMYSLIGLWQYCAAMYCSPQDEVIKPDFDSYLGINMHHSLQDRYRDINDDEASLMHALMCFWFCLGCCSITMHSLVFITACIEINETDNVDGTSRERLGNRDQMQILAQKKDIEACDCIHYDQRQCTICMDSFTDSCAIFTLSCRHLFHEECLANWLFIQLSCPVCKKWFSLDEVPNWRSKLRRHIMSRPYYKGMISQCQYKD